MSEIPAERFGNSASASLEASVFSILEDYDTDPFGEYRFLTEGQSVVWMRFKDGELTDLTADVSCLDEPFMTIINLKSTSDGLMATQANIPNFASEIADHDDYASQVRVNLPSLLEYSQQVRLAEILDEIESPIGEDYFDRELEQIIDQPLNDERPPKPSLWIRKLKTVKFFSETALVTFGSYSHYCAYIPPPIG